MAVEQHPQLVHALLQQPPTEPMSAVGCDFMIFVKGACARQSGAGGSRVHDDLTVSFVVTANTTIAR